MSSGRDVTISTAEFDAFRALFHRRTGIQFDASKRYYVDKRLHERMHATGSRTFASYLSLLRFGPEQELQTLTNTLTVNETYFYREAYQFDCLVQSMLPELLTRHDRRRPLRIWVIPSSSGEEPFSIALTLLTRWPELAEWDVEILASDIDTRILDAAHTAVYGERSVAHVPPAVLRRYFTRHDDGWQLADEVRDAVSFSRVNLTDPRDVGRFRNIDVVFCRNLLIYFDDVSRRTAAELLFEAMTPGGFICLGHSESMSRISPLFSVRAFPEALVYQKPLEAA
jgi:chemotaxis protein methyltransferase CheR